MKAIILAVLFLLGVRADGQDSITSLKTSIVFEGITNTHYKSPMLGIMCEEVFTDRRTGVNFIARGGYWYNPFVRKSNFFVLQCGASFPVNQNLDLGFYFFNLNAMLPRPYYGPNELPKNEGYYAPFAVYLHTYPWRNQEGIVNQDVYVSSEITYFTNLEKFGIQVSINYKLNRGETKWDTKKQ